MVVVSIACLFAGAAVADRAQRVSRGSVALERAAGILLVAGLAVIGAGLPLFR